MWIKVCGIRDCETAGHVAALDVDAVGLNFYSRSSRFVTVETAIEISKILPPEIVRVGVFVNHPMRELESIATRCELNILQLHGDEPPSYLAELGRRLPGLKLVRAWRMGAEGLRSLKAYLKECENWKCNLAGCLVDAQVEGVYGGSGKRVPWGKLSRQYQQEVWPPLILAGGLTAANVAEAIARAQPWGVDVASGVESSPGVKDLELVKQFVSNARNAATDQSSIE